MNKPLPTGANGRGKGGRFVAGNTFAQGNPFAKRTNEIRSLLMRKVSDDDLGLIIAKLIDLAKGGDLMAIREVFDRLLGKATQPLEIETKAEAVPTVEECARRLNDLHVPVEMWPPMLREYHDKQAAQASR